jgi:hypothetical protein
MRREEMGGHGDTETRGCRDEITTNHERRTMNNKQYPISS